MTADPPQGRRAISAESLVAAAMALTREHGLDGWTVRDLEQRAPASPSSIYHHVGSQEALCERVVEEVVERVAVPYEVEDWQEFFRVSCANLYEALTPYPGTAAWLMMHGPVLSASAVAVDEGIERLHAAGIKPAGLAYSQIVNHAMGVIAAADERRQTAAGNHALMVRRLDEEEPAGQAVGIRAMRSFLAAFAVSDPDERNAVRRAYFDAAIDVVLAGIEAGYRAGTIRGLDRFQS